MLRKFSTCLFDLDGILAKNTDNLMVKVMQGVFTMHASPLTRQEMEWMPGRSARDLIPRFLQVRGIVDPKQHEQIFRAYWENHDVRWEEEVALMPYAKEVVSALHRRNIILGIGTSSRGSIVARFIEKFQFTGLFRCIVSGDMVQERKPSPQVYLRLVELLGVPADSALVVEDRQVGVIAAKAAGLRCAAIPCEDAIREDLSKADYVFRPPEGSLKDILPLFDGA